MYLKEKKGRNPLKSGQCFLPAKRIKREFLLIAGCVAIPSNRVNVSYWSTIPLKVNDNLIEIGRNPLKSGQCFLPRKKPKGERFNLVFLLSQSPQIGSMFPTCKNRLTAKQSFKKQSQSPQIGSMFPTASFIL